jgi:hypothetical protein
MKNKKLLISSAVVLLLLAVMAGAAYAATGIANPAVLKDLAAVRQASAKYQDVNAALADGFVPTPHCVAHPELGGMGIHYVNPERIMDPGLDPLEPEILLYVDTGNGLRLVGVEYMLALGPPDAPVPDPAPPAPSLFGVSFDGPFAPPEPGMPPHYSLHVWVWQANPAGIFAPFNPNVSCGH